MPQNGESSSYVAYLPAPYQRDEFLGRFLMIFEQTLQPIERTIDNIAWYFDPRVTPEAWLPWLAGWVGQELDANWPIEQQRALVAAAVLLDRWRGTRRGLRELLRLVTGHAPLIVENFSGLRLDQDAALGVNSRLGEVQPGRIVVTARVDRDRHPDEGFLRRIVEAAKPAHVDYTLEIVEVPGGQA